MKRILTICLLLIFSAAISQTKKINILQADNTKANPEYEGGTISFGNVFVEHEGVTLRCDQAYIYQDKKLIKAMGNVIINQGDTIFQYSKYTDYDGVKKVSTSWGDVLLKDEIMELRTDTLYFDRQKQHLFYQCGGSIKDTTNVLTSKIGNYYLAENKFQAYTDVEVINPDSKLVSNHLDYYTDTGIAKLYGPSTITSEDNSIYTENGHYNSKSNISYFLKPSKIFYNDRTVEGDSLYYNKSKSFASATGSVKMVDTINNSVIKGGYAELYKEKDSVFVTKRAVAISEVEPKDSLYIHGQILLIVGKEENRLIKAFNKVKFFKSDLQGKCDSLVSNEKTGLTEMLINPVVWAQGNQMTGDTIHLLSNPKTEQLDSLKILSNGFMVKKDSAGFSQIKGKVMYGKFIDNELRTMDIIGNSESIIFLRDEKNELFGIDKKQCSQNIFIEIDNNQISTVSYFKTIDAKTFPLSQFPETEQKLKGFIWREDERPLTKDDIFNGVYSEQITQKKPISDGLKTKPKKENALKELKREFPKNELPKPKDTNLKKN